MPSPTDDRGHPGPPPQLRPPPAAAARGGALADPAAASLPFLLAELRLLDLAGGGLGQFTDDLDRSGPHVAGEVLLGERQDVLLRGVLALLEIDKGLGPLAPL